MQNFNRSKTDLETNLHQSKIIYIVQLKNDRLYLIYKFNELLNFFFVFFVPFKENCIENNLSFLHLSSTFLSIFFFKKQVK